ncbi:putative membrane protein [Cytobacillus eiseniae]|uniref:Membrane protein n=1 Tax=Cytobacillus eiseniae TaxID=762947 RepID=A0ABS4RK11_9BACI|nr:PH domain-containing protein [Cytobacillus eiseniae]MBP2243245.1 putative membrane protein [Cytobacillus eiseniae]
MSEPRRLHPISAVINCLKQLKDLLIPFLVFVVFGSKNGLFQLIVSVGIIVIVLIAGILTWLRFTYRLEEGELRIEYGVFVRKKRYIPFERIQSLDLSEGILQRPFNLVKVKVETAGSGGEAEAVLTAISKAEADSIQQVLTSAQQASFNENEEFNQEKPKEEIVYKITFKQLLLLSSTSGGVGVVISAVFAFIFQFEEVIPYEKIFSGLEDVISSGVMMISFLVLIGFFIAWAVALIGMMLKYSDFTVKKVDEDLIITRGLLEKRQLTIPLYRIQAIRISENLVRQPLGLGTVYMESAGGSLENAESARVMLLPIVKSKEIMGILSPYIPDYCFDPVIKPLPNRALRRYLFRGLVVILPLAVLAMIFFSPWGYLSILFILLAIVLSYFKYRDAGWKVDDQQLSLRYRSIIRNTVYMKRNRIQTVSVRESYFQNKKDLASIEATAMSGTGGTGGLVADLEKKDACVIYQWYSYTKSEEFLKEI